MICAPICTPKSEPHEQVMANIFPLCFSSLEQYERWRKSFQCPRSHCHDCLPAYQLRMKKQRRCEHPETMFTLDEEGGVVGHRA